jgi:hypothetical protein
MIGVKFEVSPENLDAITALLESTEGVNNLMVEDPDDEKLRPISVTNFYKMVNAANLCITENRMVSQRYLQEEGVLTWEV